MTGATARTSLPTSPGRPPKTLPVILSLQKLEFVFDPVTRLSHCEFKSRLSGLMGSLKTARTRQGRRNGAEWGWRRISAGAPSGLGPSAAALGFPPPHPHPTREPFSPTPTFPASFSAPRWDRRGGHTPISSNWLQCSHLGNEGVPHSQVRWGQGRHEAELGDLVEGAGNSVKTNRSLEHRQRPLPRIE